MSEELAQLDKIEETLSGIETRLEQAMRVQTEIQTSVAAVLRLLTVAGKGDYPEALTSRRFGLASRHEEDGITYALLQEIGDRPLRRFVQIGAGTSGGNSGFLAEELGFEGLMVDASRKCVTRLLASAASGRIKVARVWITAENVNQIVSEKGLATEVDVLSLETGGNDYWIWKELSACRPRIAIVEYNSLFGPHRSVVVPYHREFSIAIEGPLTRAYYGASLKALTDLGVEKGYRLVAVEPNGINAFFLRTDLASHIPACAPAVGFRIRATDRARVARGFDIWEIMAKEKRPIIDLAEQQAVRD